MLASIGKLYSKIFFYGLKILFRDENRVEPDYLGNFHNKLWNFDWYDHD